MVVMTTKELKAAARAHWMVTVVAAGTVAVAVAMGTVVAGRVVRMAVVHLEEAWRVPKAALAAAAAVVIIKTIMTAEVWS